MGRHVLNPKLTPQNQDWMGLTIGKDVSIENIRPSTLTADMDYQRDPKRRYKKIEAMVVKYDRRLIGVLHVCKRDSGHTMVIDGLGRKTVMAMVGDDEPVPCVVHHHIKTLKQEAEWFLRLNPDEVAKVTPNQKFIARISAGDQEAIAINREAVGGGLAVYGGGKNGISIQSASALHNLGVLERVGFIKRAAWPNLKVSGTIYVSLGGFVGAAVGLNEARLRDVLAKYPPDMLIGLTRAEFGVMNIDHQRDQSPRVARTILKIYNKGATVNRITCQWHRADQLLAKNYDQWRPME